MPMHRPVLKIMISIDFQKCCKNFANLIYNLYKFLDISLYSIYNTIMTIFLKKC